MDVDSPFPSTPALRYTPPTMQPDLASGVIWYVVFVYSTVCHEAAHAWTSHRLGDSTAYLGGQVSLDPTPHIRREPIGMILMPIVSFLANGWVMGWASAPYDPNWALRYPRRSALMAIAGPIANLLLAALAIVLMVIGAKAGVFSEPHGIRLDQIIISNSGPAWAACAQVLSIMLSLNVLLFLFNLLPLPPMDGSAIPLFFLKGQSAEAYQRMIWQPVMQIFGFIVAFQGFKYVFLPVYLPLLEWLYRIL
jgi:Zn-dependent protease